MSSWWCHQNQQRPQLLLTLWYRPLNINKQQYIHQPLGDLDTVMALTQEHTETTSAVAAATAAQATDDQRLQKKKKLNWTDDGQPSDLLLKDLVLLLLLPSSCCWCWWWYWNGVIIYCHSVKNTNPPVGFVLTSMGVTCNTHRTCNASTRLLWWQWLEGGCFRLLYTTGLRLARANYFVKNFC